VATRRASRRAQRGVALLGLLAIAVMVFAYVLTSRLNAASRFVGIDRDSNAKVLSQAKQALIGYMAQQAAMPGENNPGHLPCPEAPANFGTVNEGIEASFCAAPAVGRLPWRTLGLGKLVDAAGEPLWYAVSVGWHRPSSAATLTINSDSPSGQLNMNGTASGDVVAVIIAPGAAMTVQASADCTAWTQTRATAGVPDLRNYLECGNDAANYVTSSAGNTFNDQVLQVARADVLPALEAAIAERMQREIAPALKAAAYTSVQYAGIPAGTVLYPYPVPFTDPATSGYLGVAGSASPQGLLPFNQISEPCSTPPPCTTLPVSHPHSVRSTLYGYLVGPSCSTSATKILCQGQYHEDTTDPTRAVRIEMAATFSNVAMGFRALAANPLLHMTVEAKDDGTTSPVLTPVPSIVQIRMNDGSALPDGTSPPRGSVTIRFQATMPNIDANGWGTVADFSISINRAVFDDHALLKTTDATLGWFVRNEWYRNTYYAVPQANTADWLPSLGCSAASNNCLLFNDRNVYNIRALLVLAGRSLPTRPSRPSNNLLAYVEDQNGDGGIRYEQHRPKISNIASTTANPVPPGDFILPWNDRVILVDWDAASPPNAQQVVSLTPIVRVVSQP
jgi:hypothetical protein